MIYRRENMNSSVIKSVTVSDIKQWAAWRRLSPAQRLDECARIWWETYEIRKKAKRNVQRAVQRGFSRTAKV